MSFYEALRDSGKKQSLQRYSVYVLCTKRKGSENDNVKFCVFLRLSAQRRTNKRPTFALDTYTNY